MSCILHPLNTSSELKRPYERIITFFSIYTIRSSKKESLSLDQRQHSFAGQTVGFETDVTFEMTVSECLKVIHVAFDIYLFYVPFYIFFQLTVVWNMITWILDLVWCHYKNCFWVILLSIFSDNITLLLFLIGVEIVFVYMLRVQF